ncbi:hypothetical protein ANCDUO_12346 [Ancylostoma duodenale]|uniref:Endoplasmic reticulum vesicle transporter C-terminal domain-containing protein n=1 Tax=Ancylostoma duodenale TaxID=51022 RepID=A0A0C2GEZ7_9BILA|nr:hypothetical protein ANCDUO_12346 [Ancylostoma duodenale]
MSLETDGLRQRRTGVKRLVEDLDIFEKVVDNVKEEKKLSSGLISIICFSVIFCLVFGEVVHYFSGRKEYDYRFDVDTAIDEILLVRFDSVHHLIFSLPNLDIDLVVATPCNNLAVMSSMDESGGIFAPLQQSIQKDPTRFEFTEEEQMYWTVLRHAHAAINHGGLRGLEELQYVDSDVEDNLEELANKKQKDEAAALTEQRRNQKDSDGPGNGQLIFMIGNGMGMFQIVASNGVDEGTACRVHGKFPVRKGKEEKITISIGTSLGLGVFAHIEGFQKSGNISHRIEKFNFGRRVRGLVAPLAGAEQISESGQDIYRYFIKIVPTKIYQGIFGRFTMAYQYSVTFLVSSCSKGRCTYCGYNTLFQKKKLNEGEHSHGGILFEYEFCANVIEIREAYRSLITLLVRLCAVVGGVFATSRIINNVIQLILSVLPWAKVSTTSPVHVEKTALLNSGIVVR